MATIDKCIENKAKELVLTELHEAQSEIHKLSALISAAKKNIIDTFNLEII